LEFEYKCSDLSKVHAENLIENLSVDLKFDEDNFRELFQAKEISADSEFVITPISSDKRSIYKT
jgi:hypothetical protein